MHREPEYCPRRQVKVWQLLRSGREARRPALLPDGAPLRQAESRLPMGGATRHESHYSVVYVGPLPYADHCRIISLVHGGCCIIMMPPALCCVPCTRHRMTRRESLDFGPMPACRQSLTWTTACQIDIVWDGTWVEAEPNGHRVTDIPPRSDHDRHGTAAQSTDDALDVVEQVPTGARRQFASSTVVQLRKPGLGSYNISGTSDLNSVSNTPSRHFSNT